MPVSIVFLVAAGLLALVALLGFLALLRKRGYDKDAILDPSQRPSAGYRVGTGSSPR